MRAVWEPFGPAAMPRFYQRDVIGHHRRQEISYADIETRLSRASCGSHLHSDLVADRDKLALRLV
jgi:hypothetical protein